MILKDSIREKLDKLRDIDKECYVDVKDDIKKPPVALSFGTYTNYDGETSEVPIGTYGNFSFVYAPPKMKKTYLISLLTAAYLSGTTPLATKKMKGHRGDRIVLHFDTEQGKYHAQGVFRRVVRICDFDTDEIYHSYALRPIDYHDRFDFIEYQMHKFSNRQEIGLVVIDGVADLVSDVNDLEQANECVQRIMELTHHYNCHIITVIHSNYGTDKATGHLGSLLEKKAETQILLSNNGNNVGEVLVECKRSRNVPFENFAFKVNKQGYPEVIGEVFNFETGEFESI